MVYKLIIKNKSGVPVLWKGVPCEKFVLDFEADEDTFREHVERILNGLNTEDAFIATGIEEVKENLFSQDSSIPYSFKISGFTVAWRSE